MIISSKQVAVSFYPLPITRNPIPACHPRKPCSTRDSGRRTAKFAGTWIKRKARAYDYPTFRAGWRRQRELSRPRSKPSFEDDDMTHQQHLNDMQLRHAAGLIELVAARLEVHGDQQQAALARAAAQAVERLQREIAR